MGHDPALSFAEEANCPPCAAICSLSDRNALHLSSFGGGLQSGHDPENEIKGRDYRTWNGVERDIHKRPDGMRLFVFIKARSNDSGQDQPYKESDYPCDACCCEMHDEKPALAAAGHNNY